MQLPYNLRPYTLVIGCLVGCTQSVNQGWIRICSLTGTKTIYAGGCPRGILSSTAFDITRACANGIWVVSNGPCDDKPVILVGRGERDCFNLNMKADRMTFLGKPSDPFASGDYIGSSFLSTFWKLGFGKTSTDKSDIHNYALLSVNSDNVIQSQSATGSFSCCVQPNSQTPKPINICFGQAHIGQYFQVQSTCAQNSKIHPSQVLSSFSLNYGESLQLANENWNQSTIIAAADPVGAECGIQNPILETDCCKALEFEDNDAQVAEEQKRINEQTGRIATKYLHWTLWRKKQQKVEHKEYIYLELGRKIIGQICPREDQLGHLLDAMMHLFRMLLIETMESSPFIKHFETKRNERILEALKTCFRRSKTSQPMKINWMPKGQCPPKVRTVSATDEKSSTREFPMDLLLNQTFQYEHLDFPLETVWKIMSFTHYFCAKEFRLHPMDHSQLMVSMESFFNLDLIRRWANPGKSYQVLRLLFTTLNLPRFATTLDACVTGAKATSDYRQWIHRPILLQLGPRSRSDGIGWIWDNSTYCLNSFWDAEGKGHETAKIHPKTKAPCFPSYNKFYQT